MRDRILLGVGLLAWLGLTVLLGRFALARFPAAGGPAVGPRATALVIVAIPLGLGLLDVLLYWLGGNASTISAVMLGVRAAQPLVGVSTAYSFGVLLGHFFFPRVGAAPPPPHEVIGRMFVALSPTFYALTIISAGNGTLDAHRKALEAGGQLAFAAYMLAAAAAGGVVGHTVLPQNVAP